MDLFADQRGLAKASYGGDEGQFAARTEAMVQLLDQVGTRHQVWPDGRDIEFGCQEGRGHRRYPRICRSQDNIIS
jgi:hypothetical protein